MRRKRQFMVWLLLLCLSLFVFLAGCGGRGTPSYRVPGYTGKLEGKSFRDGTLIYTSDRYAIWFKNSEGKYFCINGGAKTLTGDIPYMPGDVNAYFNAAEQ